MHTKHAHTTSLCVYVALTVVFLCPVFCGVCLCLCLRNAQSAVVQCAWVPVHLLHPHPLACYPLFSTHSVCPSPLSVLHFAYSNSPCLVNSEYCASMLSFSASASLTLCCLPSLLLLLSLSLSLSRFLLFCCSLSSLSVSQTRTRQKHKHAHFTSTNTHFPSIHLSTYLPIDLPIYLTIHLSTHLSTYLSFNLSMCLSLTFPRLLQAKDPSDTFDLPLPTP